MPHPQPLPRHRALPAANAIRVGVGLLAAIAFALSYDALRQMAVAIHVREPLTYAFPLIIDGFIAIGVAALLILRTAPWPSRLYVWALVGIATATSIWANALHAVLLNQQIHGTGLHLDDLTVGTLSAIAPLALAGSVHLYLVIRRHPAPRPREADATERRTPANHSHNGIDNTSVPAPVDEAQDTRAPTAPDVADDPADVASDTTDVATAPRPSAEPQAHESSEIPAERLAIARTAPLGRNGRASRRQIEDTFRSAQLTIGRKKADRIKDILQAELDEAASQRQGGRDADPIGAA